MLFRHVAERSMNERIRQVGHTGKIERHRFHTLPHAFNAQVPELVAKVTIGEEFAEFGDHVKFEFHEEFFRFKDRKDANSLRSVKEHTLGVKVGHADFRHGRRVHRRVVRDLIPVQ